MVVLPFHTDLRSATRLQQTSSFLNRVNPKPERLSTLGRPRRRVLLPPVGALKVAVDKKPAICTADELHYVDVRNSDWRLALWRYLPSAQAPERNHPLLLLSGIGTNAIGYDLSPEVSFARYMAGQGYDTWTLELRGAGLSTLKMDSGEANGRSNVHHVNGNSRQFPVKSQAKEPPIRFGQLNFFDDFTNPSQDEEGKSFSAASQMRDFIGKLLTVIERAEGSSQPLFRGIQDRMSSGLKDIKKQLDTVVKYDWDFETYLEEDVPAAMEYIRTQSKPKDGKLLAIGHSMGGILLYATLSRCCFERRDSGLASITTLGATLDYTSSRSSLKMFLPLVGPARTVDVSMIPIGQLVSAVQPFAVRLPYASALLTTQISAPNMMEPKLFEKFLLKNVGTILPSNLILQLATAFQEQGLCNRNGTLFYKDHLGKSKVPILALAGDQDLICPPEAVYESAKLVPEHLITYKVFGELGGPHYAHYDMVGSHLAREMVYPYIVEFLNLHDILIT